MVRKNFMSVSSSKVDVEGGLRCVVAVRAGRRGDLETGSWEGREKVHS
jgi:hypothetical protein